MRGWLFAATIIVLMIPSAVMAQGTLPTITSPNANQILQGKVSIIGTTDIPNFASAELDFAYASRLDRNVVPRSNFFPAGYEFRHCRMGYHFDQRRRLYPASARDVARRLNSGCNGEDQGAERNADFNGDCNDLTNSNRADHHLDSNLHTSAFDANANHDSRIFNAYIAANIFHADIVTAESR